MIEVARILQFMATRSVPPARVLARVAARQHGVVSRPQIAALGFDGEFVNRSLQSGRLHRIHLGVYAVGHPRITREGRWMAAVLAAGAEAVLSHLSAALLWELIDRDVSSIHVLVPGRGSRRRPGIVIHRTRELAPEHHTEWSGIPVTTVGRTLLDLDLVLEVSVAEDDLGRVIGRGGRIANAIRTVARAAGARDDRRVIVDILD